ncbi:hypothetical protein D3C86_2127130 [compost metagenome]
MHRRIGFEERSDSVSRDCRKEFAESFLFGRKRFFPGRDVVIFGDDLERPATFATCGTKDIYQNCNPLVRELAR